MKKVELLSPAGNFECLYQAVHAGCDAVYLGGKKFGARKYAANFNDEEMERAVKYCHLYGVKLYVTVNTMIKEQELEETLAYIDFLYCLGVDALIVQDLGLIQLVRKYFPDFEIHASTQMHNHDDAGLKKLKEMGMSRVVLAREMSLDEIKDLKTDIEKEIFIHGALCVCYSGCCLFSSLNGGRSGNRGECVGSCRLPYRLCVDGQEISTKGKYLLSTRSLCTAPYLKEILDAGVASLKIEGRMKSPEYVGYVTRIYRRLIDAYYEKDSMKVSTTEITNLKKLYNREFTAGYLFSHNDKEIMNTYTSNHIGVEIGRVIGFYKDKIKIQLVAPLHQEDGLRFPNGEGMIVNKLYNAKDLLVNSLNTSDVAYVDNKINLRELGAVFKTTDSLLMKEIRNISHKKIGVDIKCYARVNEELVLTVSDDLGNKIIVKGKIVQRAINQPLAESRLIEQISKLGNTPFYAKNTVVEMDENIFIVMKEINEVRRQALEKIQEIREGKKRHSNYQGMKMLSSSKKKDELVSLCVSVEKEEQLKACLNDVDAIYVSDKRLYESYKKYGNVFLKVDRVSSKEEYQNERLVVTDLASVGKYASCNEVDGDYTLNVANSSSLEYLRHCGLRRITLSVEAGEETIALLSKENHDFTLFIYGKVELMIMKYHPLRMLNVWDDTKQFTLKDSFSNQYPIIEKVSTTSIMQDAPVDLLDNLSFYLKIGIRSYRIDFWNESEKEVQTILERFYEK